MDRRHVWPDPAIRNGAAKERDLLACALPSPPASYLSMWRPPPISKECQISPRATSRNPSSTSSPAAAPALWELTIASSVLRKRWWPDLSAFLCARKTRPVDSSQCFHLLRDLITPRTSPHSDLDPNLQSHTSTSINITCISSHFKATAVNAKHNLNTDYMRERGPDGSSL